ncbi:MAG: hypothetical protein MZV70_55820 [Desulfobacterales bacterium]|nr:hypothetical protein [Desulfobacterales bacterium]
MCEKASARANPPSRAPASYLRQAFGFAEVPLFDPFHSCWTISTGTNPTCTSRVSPGTRTGGIETITYMLHGEEPVRFLLVSGKPIGEPVAWRGPIVMNTQAELKVAFEEYSNGTFIKHK